MIKTYICQVCGRTEEAKSQPVSCKVCQGAMRRNWREIQFSPCLPPMKGYHPQLGDEACAKYNTWNDQRKYCEEQLQNMYEAPIKIENRRE